MDTPRVGIISHTLVQQHHLRQIAEECGFQVSSVWLIDQLIDNIALLNKEDPEGTDIWLVDVDTFSINQTTKVLSFEHWLFSLNQPIIFGEGSTFSAAEEGFQSWLRQLKIKLLSAMSQLTMQSTQAPAKQVWVLAASTGGPEAVKEFLDSLPTGLGVAFIYAQHIESGQHQALANTIARGSGYGSRLAINGDRLAADTVTVVPSHQQVDMLEEGILILREHDWRGEYNPSIDKVVAMVADCFGAQSGAIFFSGMGDDGRAGARLMSRRGGKIWVQTPDTCASASMPEAIIATDCVSKTGSPKQLAALFKQQFKSAAKETTV